MSYVDAGYAAALGTLLVYAVSLVLRRRRWERALKMSEPAAEPEGAPVPRRAAVTGTTTEPSPPPSPPTSEVHQGPAVPPPRPRRRISWRVLAVFALLAVALVFLLVEGLGSSLNYFDTVDQALANKHVARYPDVPPGGHRRPGHHPRHRGRLELRHLPGSPRHPRRQHGQPAALFRSRVPVVVVGHFTSDTSTDFVSNSILVKHSRTYIAQYPNRVKVTATGPVC